VVTALSVAEVRFEPAPFLQKAQKKWGALKFALERYGVQGLALKFRRSAGRSQTTFGQ
jgi:hypothetical protein